MRQRESGIALVVTLLAMAAAAAAAAGLALTASTEVRIAANFAAADAAAYAAEAAIERALRRSACRSGLEWSDWRQARCRHSPTGRPVVRGGCPTVHRWISQDSQHGELPEADPLQQRRPRCDHSAEAVGREQPDVALVRLRAARIDPTGGAVESPLLCSRHDWRRSGRERRRPGARWHDASRTRAEASLRSAAKPSGLGVFHAVAEVTAAAVVDIGGQSTDSAADPLLAD